MLKTSSHSGVEGYVIKNIKNQIDFALQVRRHYKCQCGCKLRCHFSQVLMLSLRAKWQCLCRVRVVIKTLLYKTKWKSVFVCRSVRSQVTVTPGLREFTCCLCCVKFSVCQTAQRPTSCSTWTGQRTHSIPLILLRGAGDWILSQHALGERLKRDLKHHRKTFLNYWLHNVCIN